MKDNCCKKKVILPGQCFRVVSGNIKEKVAGGSLCFAIAETASGYTLFQSVACQNAAEGNAQWSKSAGEIPAGWKALSDPIPANTQHNVCDVTSGVYFYLQGFTDPEGVTVIF